MSVAQNIEHYFAALERQARQSDDRQAVLGSLPFVTISRQAGAGAGLLAEALLKILAEDPDRRLCDGWRVLDAGSVGELRNRGGGQRLRALLGEDYHSQIGEFVLGLLGGSDPQDTALLRQSELLRSAAALGRVIIIGHGASQATKGLHAGVHLRLVAPLERRVGHLAAHTGLSEAEARRELEQRDRNRARLLKNHYRAEIDDPLLYDAVFNTAALDATALAAATLALVKRRAAGGG